MTTLAEQIIKQLCSDFGISKHDVAIISGVLLLAASAKSGEKIPEERLANLVGGILMATARGNPIEMLKITAAFESLVDKARLFVEQHNSTLQ